MSGPERATARVADLNRLARLGAVPVRDVACENPGMPGGGPVGRLPVDADFVHRNACRRAILSSVDGCVENSRMMVSPVNGLMMNMCAVAGEASMGIFFDHVSSFCNPAVATAVATSLTFQRSFGHRITGLPTVGGPQRGPLASTGLSGRKRPDRAEVGQTWSFPKLHAFFPVANPDKVASQANRHKAALGIRFCIYIAFFWKSAKARIKIPPRA